MGEDADPYLALGLPATATQPEIIRAFRRLLRRYHPDTRGDNGKGVASDDRLQCILSAYAVLRDPRRRADYDRDHAKPVHTPADTPWAGQAVHVHRTPPGRIPQPPPPLWAGPVIRDRPSGQ